MNGRAAPLRILLVDDDPADLRLLREALAPAAGKVDLRQVPGLGEALAEAEGVDVVLLGLRPHRDRERLIRELSGALARARALSGWLPICASCRRVRDDHGLWCQIESYLQAQAGVELTHGLCPTCAERLYEEIALWGAAEE